MTLSEFNERTNANLTEDQYKPVENMYNEAGNIQKDQFCADWTKHKDSILLQEFYEQAENCKEKLDDLRDELSRLYEFLLIQAEETGSRQIREKVIRKKGFKFYLNTRLQKGFDDLWEEDKKDLQELLENLI